MIVDALAPAAMLPQTRAGIFDVAGPSMVPDLHPGDAVVADLDDIDPRRAGIFVVWEQPTRSVLIKHVELVRGAGRSRIRCASANPLYEPFEVDLDDGSFVIGRVRLRIAAL